MGEDWWRGEQVTVADYTITVENVGDLTLSPVHLQNAFPAETAFMGSSVRPAVQTADYASWTLTHLSPGDISTVELRLLVSSGAETLIDRVYAEGECPGGSARADNISVMDESWLCCP
ncbi:MAG: DUF11 domain-containing protein [Methanotrichaceae archaeon]|nr:DUF11 domain-containing protein [Methanotrichaceae archaeon]